MKPVFRFASFASRAFTVAIGLFAAAAFGQEAPPGNEPGFSASLLLVKADWSKSGSAISISEDLQKALKDEPVPGELRGRLPASATTILFPAETALVYSRQHYLALREWLKTKDLIVELEPFGPLQLARVSPAPEKQYGTVLTKELDFFGLSLNTPAADQTFVSRKVSLTWSISMQPQPGSERDAKVDEHLSFRRTLATTEKPRGQDQYINRGVQDSCTFSMAAVSANEVLIVPAFPARNDTTFQMAAAQQGFTALVVVKSSEQRADETVEPRFSLPDKVQRLAVNKPQSTTSLWIARGQTQSPRYVISRDVMISWSEARDVAWGFSKTLGGWAKQEIQPPADDTRGLVVDDELAVWRVGSAYYAFSGKAASWDVLHLPEGHSPVQVLDSGFARVHDGDDLFTFSATTGRWSSPTGSRVAANTDAGGVPRAGASSPGPEDAAIPGFVGGEGPAASTEQPAKQFVVFHLKYLQAATADRMIRQLFPVSVAADERTNSVVVSGDSGTIEKIKTMLTEIDREPAQSSKAAAWPSAKGSEWAFEWAVENPKELAGKYEAKEREAQRLAGQIRELQTAPKEHEGPIKDLSAQLRRTVADAFAARQQLHRAEAGQLRQRLAGVDQTLKTRERLSQEIIDKRVKDLLNPDLQWETAATSPAAASASNTLNEKTGLFARLHDDPQWIENARDDFKRATTDQERKSALDVQLSWWRDIVKALRRLEQLGERIDQELASAEAGAKKTEAEIAALSAGKTPESAAQPTTATWTADAVPSAESKSQARPPQPTPPTILLSSSGETITLRSPDEFRKELRDAEQAVSNVKALKAGIDPTGKGETVTQRERDSAEKNLPSWERRLEWVREQYAAQIHLLELEVKDAESAMQSAQNAERAARDLYARRNISKNELDLSQRPLEAAKLRVERANTLLDLYRKADPKWSQAQTPASELPPTQPEQPYKPKREW